MSSSPASPPRRASPAWLLAGIALLVASQMRFGIGVLAFVAPVPFLAYLRHTTGARRRLWCALALAVAYVLATLKLVTAPLPAVFALAFATPFALSHGTAFLVSDALRRRAPRWMSLVIFPSLMVLAEFGMHRLTPFGSWAAAAYTQVENLPLLQVASLAGLAGVSFVVYLVASGIELALAEGGAGRRALGVAVGVLVLAQGYGSLRLAMASPGESQLVAAIGTDGTIGGWPLPPQEVLDRVDDALFSRTAEAARAGAKLVAWNEGANAVRPEREGAYLERLRATAREHGIELVAAYVVPDDAARTYENKYVWVRPDGTIDHAYNKHYPVPGEPAIAGTEPPTVVATAAGRATGAICYDYDFPALGLTHARLGIDLAVVPSSDWRGIDPIHTQMASLRAIEGGYSLLRSTRWGLSAGYDGYGRVRGWESSFESARRVLLVALPTRRVETLYARVGDVLVYACALIVVAALVLAGRRLASRAPMSRPAIPSLS